MRRVNTSRQTIAAKQRLSNYKPSGNIAQHVLDATVTGQGLTAQIVIRRAGRSFTCGDLQIRRGDKIILVASKFRGHYYVCSHGQWSTKDAAVIAICRQAILAHAAA
jgi:hypothetical protein